MSSKLSWHMARLLVIAAMLALGVGYAPIARAKPQATIHVNNDGDGPAVPANCIQLNPNTCRLRDAIAVAADGDTITFDGNYTIRLTSELVIPTNKSLTIDGTGHTVTLDGQNNVRVLKVLSVFGMMLNALTITNGKAVGEDGGGIYIDHTLFVVVSNSTITSNSGGGIFNYGGRLNVSNCTITSNSGGGIFTAGTLNVINSTFSGNSASGGGGIFNIDGTTNVTNSTFVGNSASNNGGGIATNIGTVNVTNSTFSGNSAAYSGGGIFNDDSTTNVTNSTFVGNSATYGGGIAIDPNSYLNYANTIIANSTSGGDCSYSSGTIQTSTNNLVQDGSCLATFSGDPKLGSLASNGGATQTFALLPNSPAIDKGNAATCADAATVNGLDQRGQARDDLQCDIGAYEIKMSDRNYATLNPGTTLRTYGPARAGIQYTGTNPGSSTVTKITTWVSQPASALSVLWDLNATTNIGLDLTLKLCYSTAELRGLTEGDLRFWRYSGGAWSQVGGVPTFSGASPNRCAQISGVTDLSRWTLATSNPGSAPTSVTLSSFTAEPRFDLGAWLKKFLGR